MQPYKLDALLFFLPPSSLRQIADYCTALGRACALRAAELEARETMQRRVAAEVAARPAPDTPYWRKIARREARAARNVEILRLAGRGWRNAEIAAKLRLSPGRVSQIIQQRLREQRRDHAKAT